MADSGHIDENNNNNNNQNPLAGQPNSSSSPTTGETAKPKEYNWDGNSCYEMFERADVDVLHEKFGGLAGICDALKTDRERGVSSASIRSRLDQFGKNELDRKEPVTFWEMLYEAVRDEIIQILFVAAIISIIFGLTLPDPYSGEVERDKGWIKGTALILSCTVVVLIGATNNYQKAKKFEELELAQSVKDVEVIRDGEVVTVVSSDLVMGDVVKLNQGLELPCDGIFLKGNMKFNESPITGEPDMIEKNESAPFLISGTSLEEGSGVMLVVAIGMQSFQGRMKNMKVSDEEIGGGKKKNSNNNTSSSTGGDDQEMTNTTDEATQRAIAEDNAGGSEEKKKDGDDEDEDDEEDEDQTPLQKHLAELADKIGQVGLALAIFVLVALSLKEVILITTDDKTASAATFLSYVIIAITLIAVAIPEGLPLAVTISLAYSMKAMLEDDCLVRILASCETMGAATAICSDKTGTLTTNQMTVVQGYLFGTEFLIDKYGCKPRTSDVTICQRENFDKSIVPQSSAELFCRALTSNSTAGEAKDKKTGEVKWVGNKTEIGLLGICAHLGFDYKALREETLDDATKNYHRFDFTSALKRMTTLVKSPTDNGLIAYVKGASEIIASRCSRYVTKSGEVLPLDDEQRILLNEIIDDMAGQGNRTISVAYNILSGQTEFPHEHPDLEDLIFLGVLGVQDPIREAVPAAVANCASAGLVVRMVTGDNATTAKAIGKKCGIFHEESDICLEGKEFREMARTNRAGLLEILPKMRILARSSPMDKYVLVRLLQDPDGLCDVVGVTGDGTNDAPALKLADVGFAMNTGTDIAKGSADMILVDDNFATVVTAIKWGRAVNDNIKKFIQYQLAINGAGVLMTVVGSLASSSSKEPIAPVQLLWLNLIMDSLAALALATELPEDASLKREPVYKMAPLITNRMWSFIGIHGCYQFLIVMLLLFLGHNWFETIEDEYVCNNNILDKTFVNGNYSNPLTKWCADRCTNVGGSLNDVTWVCSQGATHSTIIFNSFIFCQVFNVVNARKIYGEWNAFEGLWDRSKMLLAVFTFVVGLQAIAINFFGRFMSVTSLNWQMWLITIGFGAFEIIVGFFVRILPIKDFKPDAAAEKTAREKERQELQQKGEHHHGGGSSGGNSSGSSSGGLVSRRSDSSLKRSNSIMKRRGSWVGLNNNNNNSHNNNASSSNDEDTTNFSGITTVN